MTELSSRNCQMPWFSNLFTDKPASNCVKESSAPKFVKSPVIVVPAASASKKSSNNESGSNPSPITRRKPPNLMLSSPPPVKRSTRRLEQSNPSGTSVSTYVSVSLKFPRFQAVMPTQDLPSCACSFEFAPATSNTVERDRKQQIRRQGNELQFFMKQ